MGSRFRTHLWSLTTDNPGYAMCVTRMLVWIPGTNAQIAVYFCSLPKLALSHRGYIYYAMGLRRCRTTMVNNSSMKSILFSYIFY